MNKSKKMSYRQGHTKKQAQQNNAAIIGAAVLLIVAIVLFAFALQSSSNATNAANVAYAPAQGYAAPIFNTTLLSGSETSLQDYAGDVVIVNFWATWCPPCKAEMPGINAFYETHQDDGLVVLAVNAQESEALVRPFIETSGFTFPVLLDPVGKIVNQYQVHSFPTTIIIDRDGVIRHIQVGMISEEELETAVAPLL